MSWISFIKSIKRKIKSLFLKQKKTKKTKESKKQVCVPVFVPVPVLEPVSEPVLEPVPVLEPNVNITSRDPIHINLCTTHLKRITQCLSVLSHNYNLVSAFNTKSIFVKYDICLVNFFTSDTDTQAIQLDNYVKEKQFDNKTLKYIKCRQTKYWHSAMCKNTAHMHCNGEYLINMDGDLEYTVTFLNRIATFIKNRIDKIDDCVIHAFTGKNCDGTYGIIGCSRNTFISVNGYNHNTFSCGGHDNLLLNAIKKKIGSKIQLLSCLPDMVLKERCPNNKLDTIINTKEYACNKNIRWMHMNINTLKTFQSHNKIVFFDTYDDPKEQATILYADPDVFKDPKPTSKEIKMKRRAEAAKKERLNRSLK